MRSPVDRLDLTDEHYEFWREMHPKLAEKGWLHPTYPKEYGGGGLSGEHETILMEEFERARVVGDFTNPFVFATLLVWATEEQKEKFLTPLLKADKVAFQNFTEPNAGSDLASLQSRAVRDGDDWIITGQKIFISGHGDPDWLFGPIVTDPDAPRHRNLGYFMIPYPSPGLELTRLNLLTGHDQSFFFMDGVRVPGDHLIGGEQQGWQVTQTTLEIEHGGRGVAFPRDEAMENLLGYVKDTKSNGGTLGSDPIVQQDVMAAYIESHTYTLLAQRNYWMYQARQEMSYHGSQADLYRRVHRMRNADRARDIMGMYSMLGVDEPRAPFAGQPEVYQRSSLVGAHPGGTVEVQKVIIARRLGISRTRERAAATPSTTGVSGV
jgi:alkylation response protein AidB-like acyl-CoA dehydrogenase